LLLGAAEVEPLRAVVAELLGHEEVSGHLAGMISGLDVRYPTGSDAALLGTRVPHWKLIADTGPTTVAELLHGGGGVLLDFTLGLSRGVVGGWADRVRLVRAATPDDLETDAQDVRAVLLRPDGHIAWTNGCGIPLGVALHRWFGAPAGGRA